MTDKSDHYFSIVYRLGSFLKIVMENDLCKSGGLPLQFIMITTNDDEDDWDDDNDSEESFNDTLIPFNCQAQVPVQVRSSPGPFQVQVRSSQVLTWTWTWTKHKDLG